MTFFSALSKEGVKGLGSGAYLVSLVPSAVMIISVFALFASNLYPWATPRVSGGEVVAPGLSSIVDTITELKAAGAVVFVIVVLIATILLNPFQIAIVQLLEGYWSSRVLLFPQSLVYERHVRKRSMALWRSDEESYRLNFPTDTDFGTIANYYRSLSRMQRQIDRAERLLASYPRGGHLVLPTRLGNILRRAETTAGERYGLFTVPTYSRLYPHLSPQLGGQLSNQLNSLDANSALTLVLAVLALASSPLIMRWDGWIAVPLAAAVGSSVAYRGARRAAEFYASLLCAAYDLHRFQMLEAMHRAIPDTPETERELNDELSRFLLDHEEGQVLPRLTHQYRHPAPNTILVPSTTTGPAAAGSEGGTGGAEDSSEKAQASSEEDRRPGNQADDR